MLSWAHPSYPLTGISIS